MRDRSRRTTSYTIYSKRDRSRELRPARIYPKKDRSNQKRTTPYSFQYPHLKTAVNHARSPQKQEKEDISETKEIIYEEGTF
jgi:hypothetical protein